MFQLGIEKFGMAPSKSCIIVLGCILLDALCFVHLHFQQTSKNQIRVDLVDENFTELRGEIAGPPDTPYEGMQAHSYSCNFHASTTWFSQCL